MSCSHLFNDPFLQQALLFGSHDKVVGVVFIVDNILQIDTWNGESIELKSGQGESETRVGDQEG